MAALILSVLIFSTTVQTNWSDGPGIEGPVTQWTSSFYDSDGIAWLSIPGQICLCSEPMDPPVQHDLSMTYSGCYCARVGDLNGDGLDDIAASANGAEEVRIWLADGQGGWNQYVVDSEEYFVGCDIADLNDDGMTDILAASYEPGAIHVYYNQGGPVPDWDLQIVDQEINGGHDIMAVDLDLDGDLDIVASAALDDVMHWWRNDGGTPTQWTKKDIGTIDYPCRFDVADLDGDGNQDVVVAGYESNTIELWYGSGGPDPAWTHQMVADPVNGAHGLRVADLDCDGDPDLAASAMNGGKIFWMRNDGGYPLSWVRNNIGAFAASSCTEAGDLDGDGDCDVSSGSFGSAGIAWWENQSSGTVWLKHQLGSGMGTFPLALPADVDMDGDLDVLACGASANRFLWFEMSTFSPSGYLESSILDIQGQPLYASIDWDAELPSGTGMTVQYRTSNNPSEMGDWSMEYSSPSCLSGLVERYFQWRVNFSTSDAGVSPILYEFLFGWDTTGIEPQASGGSLDIQSVQGNPTSGSLQLEVTHPEDGEVQMLFYDFSGRTVHRSEEGLQGGCAKSFLVRELPSGVYFVQGIHSSGDESVLPVVLL